MARTVIEQCHDRDRDRDRNASCAGQRVEGLSCVVSCIMLYFRLLVVSKDVCVYVHMSRRAVHCTDSLERHLGLRSQPYHQHSKGLPNTDRSIP